jgi:hypothetical protein
VAKKKKADEKDLGELVDELVSEVGADRDRLTKFLDNLITQYDGDQAVGIAEYVAKLVDALTRQHQVKASAIKVLAKEAPKDDDQGLDDIAHEIGMPFEELDDGGN